MNGLYESSRAKFVPGGRIEYAKEPTANSRATVEENITRIGITRNGAVPIGSVRLTSGIGVNILATGNGTRPTVNAASLDVMSGLAMEHVRLRIGQHNLQFATQATADKLGRQFHAGILTNVTETVILGTGPDQSVNLKGVIVPNAVNDNPTTPYGMHLDASLAHIVGAVGGFDTGLIPGKALVGDAHNPISLVTRRMDDVAMNEVLAHEMFGHGYVALADPDPAKRTYGLTKYDPVPLEHPYVYNLGSDLTTIFYATGLPPAITYDDPQQLHYTART
jgi:hypothetical protein